jgi:hypothetical protein
MNRDQLIRALRHLAKKRGVLFEVDTKKGNGSHYRIKFDDKITILQQQLNEGRIERVLKQIGLSIKDLQS